jgi:peptidoglycan/LPS O-acetylase OafA/YrhL
MASESDKDGMNKPFSAYGRRLPELDGVRGVAILLVLLWHYVQNQLVVEVGSPLAFLKQTLGFAWSGVDLFFVLSGFLITGILIDNRKKSNYFKVFYIRRACRIFPLYYLYFLIFLAMVLFSAGRIPYLSGVLQQTSVPIWSYATYTQNIFMGIGNTAGTGWLAVTWSLAIEEQFYLVLPFLVYLFPKRWLPLLFLWFAVMAIYLRFTMPGLSAYINTPWRADSLMVGALLAYLIRIPVFVDQVVKHRVFVLILLCIFASGLMIANHHGQLKLGGAITHVSLAVLYGLFILYVVTYRKGILASSMRNRILMWMGSISYGVYLFHTNISSVMHGLIRGTRPYMASWQDAMVTLLALALTLLLAQLSYSLFEKRILQYGHRFKYK